MPPWPAQAAGVGAAIAIITQPHLLMAALPPTHPTTHPTPPHPLLQYTYALFRSTSGLLATGWGMSPPTSIEEVWFCLVMEFVGSLLQLTLQAAILALVRTYDRSTSNYMQRTEMVKVGWVVCGEGAGRGAAWLRWSHK